MAYIKISQELSRGLFDRGKRGVKGLLTMKGCAEGRGIRGEISVLMNPLIPPILLLKLPGGAEYIKRGKKGSILP